jgi:hypothetical protein
MMRKMAAFQEAFLRYHRGAGVDTPAVHLDPDDRYRHFPSPCSLPSTFPDAIRDIMDGHSVVKLEKRSSIQRNMEDMSHAYKGWSFDDWRENWERLMERELKMPPGGIGSWCDGYADHGAHSSDEWSSIDSGGDNDDDDEDETDEEGYEYGGGSGVT